MAGIKSAIGIVGNAAAFALVIGFGGDVASYLVSTTEVVTYSAAGITPASMPAPAHVDYAILTADETAISFGNQIRPTAHSGHDSNKHKTMQRVPPTNSGASDHR